MGKLSDMVGYAYAWDIERVYVTFHVGQMGLLD